MVKQFQKKLQEHPTYIDWKENTSYPKGTIVKYLDRFHSHHISCDDFIGTLWTSLPSLSKKVRKSNSIYRNNW